MGIVRTPADTAVVSKTFVIVLDNEVPVTCATYRVPATGAVKLTAIPCCGAVMTVLANVSPYANRGPYNTGVSVLPGTVACCSTCQYIRPDWVAVGRCVVYELRLLVCGQSADLT